MRLQTRLLLSGHEIGQEVLQWYCHRGRVREIDDGEWFKADPVCRNSSALLYTGQLMLVIINITPFSPFFFFVSTRIEITLSWRNYTLTKICKRAFVSVSSNFHERLSLALMAWLRSQSSRLVEVHSKSMEDSVIKV